MAHTKGIASQPQLDIISSRCIRSRMPTKPISRTEVISRIVALLLALIGAFLGFADKVGDAPEFLKEYSHLWPMFVTGAIVAKQILLIAMDALDDGKQNNSYTP